MTAIKGKKDLPVLLFGASTRRAILALLFGHTEESYYLRQIARITGYGLGPVQRELRQLADAGLIRRFDSGHQVYFQANPDSPVFKELKGLITKTIGVADTLRSALTALSDSISLAFIYGSVARGQEQSGSDIDLMIVGETTLLEVVKTLRGAQDALGREINPTIYSIEEFRSRVNDRHYFIQDVLAGEKIFIKGNENELKRMAG
ncbi:DNA polymerase beta domain protein region [Dehalogenimonas lykanthroporepellens BL-DC-9]|nr:DNA polymerase beta domain protein region [Dehalogenimonas lykanthroporepellens BL-DC-9]